eukprot:TRINITY_DN40907_c0_g1_i1.p1 TRINITY_DN40907_c0_g1~~TRINITY_DN40907_c0_g1_i1.p1  ORF type:complete len:245 (-),score=36.50 TRINITY_DN40907_c0_g1_i1:201-935(-)
MALRKVLIILAFVNYTAWAALDEVLETALELGSECEGSNGSCALNALQTRALQTDEPTGDARWTMAPSHNESMLGFAPPPHPRSHRYMATTTRYGYNHITGCMLDSHDLVAGTDYIAVAAASSMHGGGTLCWKKGGGGASASMGCGSCAKGKFIRQLPRGFKIWTPESTPIFHKEYKLVVVDSCPHSDNGLWCPAPHHRNTFGVANHFDMANPPDKFDNYYFEFSPMECSSEIKSRFKRLSKCH